jgi:hypothetical protein
MVHTGAHTLVYSLKGKETLYHFTIAPIPETHR